jgi:hypothetical protein
MSRTQLVVEHRLRGFHWFSSPSGASVRRRPTDVVLLAASILGLLRLAPSAPGPTTVDGAITTAVQALPSYLDWAFSVGYALAVVWGLLLLLVTAAMPGRRAVALYLLVAAAFAFALAALVGLWAGTGWDESWDALRSTGSSPMYAAVQIAVVTGVVVTASPQMSQPVRRVGRLLLAVRRCPRWPSAWPTRLVSWPASSSASRRGLPCTWPWSRPADYLHLTAWRTPWVTLGSRAPRSLTCRSVRPARAATRQPSRASRLCSSRFSAATSGMRGPSAIRPARPGVLSLADPGSSPFGDAMVLLTRPRIHDTGLAYDVTLVGGTLPLSSGSCVLNINARVPTEPEGGRPDSEPDRRTR